MERISRRTALAGIAAAGFAVGCSPVPSRSTPGNGALVDVEPVLADVAFIGDFGVERASADRVADLVKSWDPGRIFTTGDNIYSSADYQRVVGRLYGDHVAARRFHPVPGNHDYIDAGPQLYTAYFGVPLFYNLRVGPVEYFMLDSEGGRDPDVRETQRSWLAAAATSSTATFKVVVLHDPPFSSGPYGSSPRFQWDFAAWGVDLVMSGHEHMYERIQGDTTYVVNGIGGASLGQFGSAVEGSAVRFNRQRGAMRMKVDLHALHLQCVTHDGEIVDDFVLRAEG